MFIYHLIDFIFSHKFVLEDITQLVYFKGVYIMDDLNGTVRPKTNVSWILFIVIVIVGLAIYWLLIRPGQIKKECHDYAYGTPNLGNTQEWVTATKYYYEACLRRNGL